VHDAASPRTAPRGDSPERKLAVLRELLLSTAGAVRTAEDWARSLRAAARLPGESFANIILIEAQRPGATLLKGYEEWRAAGRQVIRGEQGIEVFSRSRPAAPGQNGRRRSETEPPAPSWRDAPRVAYIWDVTQTNGPPASIRAALPAATNQAPPGMWDALCWLARREGFAVEREYGAPADGVTFWTARRIRVLPGLESGLAAWALAHQLGHVIMHGASPHQPGATSSGDACTGIRKAEADAVAFITTARYGLAATCEPASPSTWAGTDPRAQPAIVILAAGERITSAAARVTRHLDSSLPGSGPASQPPARAPAPAQRPRRPPPAATQMPPAPEPAVPATRLSHILRDAGAFYSAQLAGTWVPAYLHSRGISPDAVREWRFGYAPPGWAALTGHLRAAGYSDEEMEAAGMARRSSRGTLIDQFRDRVMLPVRDQHGRVTGFVGRARPGAGPAVPKYLNTPETSLYKKGDLLFGLHEARNALGAGATPVIVEGPFDAIAVTIAGAGHLAGLAPCGTALTTGQAALLAKACNLGRAGAIAAFDDDPAGRKAAIRAYGILRPYTASLQSASLSERDPAQILQEQGPQALRKTLTATAEPLLGVVVDADVSRWEHRRGDVEGPVRAMRSACALLAELLPPSAAEQVRAAARGAMLATVDEEMKPVVSPQVPGIAQALPADTAHQVTRLADRLGLPLMEIVIEVANAVTRQSTALTNPKSAAGLAAGSFPTEPLEMPAADPMTQQPQRASQSGHPVYPAARCDSRNRLLGVIRHGYRDTDREHDHGIPLRTPATAA
jgi:DNA primase